MCSMNAYKPNTPISKTKQYKDDNFKNLNYKGECPPVISSETSTNKEQSWDIPLCHNIM